MSGGSVIAHADPDTAFYLNAGSQINADSDPGQTMSSQKNGFWHEKFTFCRYLVACNKKVPYKSHFKKAGNQVFLAQKEKSKRIICIS